MKTYKYGLIFVLIVSGVLISACGGTSPTPTSGGCNQFGCPYPAVCDLQSGQCVISVTSQAPVVHAPNPIAGAANSQNSNPIGLAPTACAAPTPAVGQVNTFCANQSAGLGGATFEYSPPAGAINYSSGNNVNCTYSNQNSKATCSGPQYAKFQEVYCTSCGGGDAPGSPVFANASCSKGYTKDASGNCQPSDPAQQYSPCPTGSHYDNSKQYCVDDVSGQNLADLCPAGTQTYLPDYHYCLPASYPEEYYCQSFPLTLGGCIVPKVKAACQPPAGGCGMGMNGSPLQWDKATCSCK